MLRIHIMNSVKGGSGKSTFSLYLANYLKTNDYNPVIIDLDVCGSTWFSNNESYIQNAKNCIFLNDLFYNYEQKSKKEHIFKLNISNNGNPDVLKVIMADPKKLSSMKDETLDLLENTVIQLVDELINPKYQTVHDKEKVTDIIFDMPPGYEKHSEQIIKHMIMDLESGLNQKFYSKKSFCRVNGMQVYKQVDSPYLVYYYMLSNFNEAAYTANLQYLKNFFVYPNYSQNNNIMDKTLITFILNDVTGISDFHVRSGNIKTTSQDILPTLLHNKNIQYPMLKDCKVFINNHFHFGFEFQKLLYLFGGRKTPDHLEFGPETTQFDNIFNTII